MPSQFTNPLTLISRPDFRFETDRDLVYQIGALGTNIPITVPKGFVTDLASVPRLLWPIFPPFGPWAPAAVLHDYLYSLVAAGQFRRRIADDLFLEAMETLGVSPWRRRAMFYAVRIFGGLFASTKQEEPSTKYDA